ncbi:MAG: hypothetical protein AAGF60_02570 [Pseudomonadota bacterium]
MNDAERAEHLRKIDAEIAKLIAETAEIQQNMKYRFWVMGAAYIGAMAVLLRAL